jgi:hypothetical protein
VSELKEKKNKNKKEKEIGEGKGKGNILMCILGLVFVGSCFFGDLE